MKCPECHWPFADNTMGKIVCPDCHTAFNVLVDRLGIKNIKVLPALKGEATQVKRDVACDYRFDAQGDTLTQCGSCRDWARLSSMRPVVVGRFVLVEMLVDGVWEERWMPRTRKVLGCTACQDLFWWETLKTNARSKASGRALSAFISPNSRSDRALDQQQTRLAERMRELEARIEALAKA